MHSLQNALINNGFISIGKAKEIQKEKSYMSYITRQAGKVHAANVQIYGRAYADILYTNLLAWHRRNAKRLIYISTGINVGN